MVKDKKLQISVATLLLLCVGLCVASFAISFAIIKIENNTFRTGGIDIDLNHGKPIVPEGKWLLEPGMTVKEDFTITNNGSWKVFYKLYFEEVSGKLKDVLEITIYKKGRPDVPLLKGKVNDLVDADQLNIASELEAGEEQVLTAQFHFPKEYGNEYMSESLEFKMSAIAVQAKNNINKEFE